MTDIPNSLTPLLLLSKKNLGVALLSSVTTTQEVLVYNGGEIVRCT
jgi:hypothetical protein